MDNEVMLKNFKDMLGFYGENISAAKYDAIINANKPAGRTLRRRFGSWLKAKNLALGKEEPQQPKILLLDIETAPMEVLVWGLYKQHIPQSNIIEDWFCLGWSAKWLFDSDIMSDILSPKEAVAKSDERILREIWKLLDEADIVIAHNASKFDIRKLNARFLKYGLTPTSPYRVIDTLTVAKRNFALSSYALTYICTLLGLPNKLNTSYGLWKKCIAGDKESLKYMEKYNRQDIVALEEVYIELRPWIKGSINVGLYVETDKPICPNCGCTDLDWRGYYYTNVSKFRAFSCKGCGAIGRERTSSYPKDKRKALVVSTAR